MGETAQDKETTSEPGKVIKRVKKLKVSKQSVGTSHGSGVVEGMLLLNLLLSLHFVNSFDAKSSMVVCF